MKQRVFFLVMITVVFSLFIFSCASSPPIEPESLIGTRWVSGTDPWGRRHGLMFVDEEHCLLVDSKKSVRTRYSIRGNKIVIDYVYVEFVYELKDNVLYKNGKPEYTQDFSPIIRPEEKEEQEEPTEAQP